MNGSTRATLTSRLGRRFLFATAGVLSAALGLIVIAAQAMFISRHDLRLLMWVLVPAVLAAGAVAVFVARPIADDARRLCDAARRVAAGDLRARTEVRRTDELGEAAEMFDLMVERLEAVERERSLMLSAISHDLRTPLAALRAGIEAMQDGLVAETDDALASMDGQVRALAELVDDLMLHARLEAGTVELRRSRLDLTDLVDEALEVMRPLADRAEVALDMRALRHVWITGDGAQLSRVIRNLVDNAIRHAPRGTQVTVEVDVEIEEGGVEVGPRAGSVRLRVLDDGAGFPAGSERAVFEPFTRLDEARRPGSGVAGLGLTIARGIVDAHGGTIDAIAGPGGTIEVRLPVETEGRTAASPS